MSHARSAELLEQAKAGAPEALNALYERVSGRLLAFIRLRLGRELRGRLESRDILQAALLKSVGALSGFRGHDSRAFMAWLTRIAEHEIRDCADHQQRQRRDAARETPLDALDSHAPVRALTRSALSRVILDEDAARLEAAIDSLSPEHRDVILMRHFAELPFAEIGRRTARSEDAARMLFARAMTALTLRLATPRR